MIEPTAEQKLILQEVQTTSRNLSIVARAGAAKSTTLVMIAKAALETEPLVLAFNKKIAEEMATRLPDRATAKTINSLGNTAWKDFLGRWPKLNDAKCREDLRTMIKELPAAEQGEAWDSFSDMLRAIGEAKTSGYLPLKVHPSARPLISDHSFYETLEIETTDLFRQLVDEVLILSFKKALKGEIDFNDQIYCPALMPCSFPRPWLTLIDEAQDLSPLNHVILKKLVGNRRLIAVGDPCQAIYGFRGAMENSMEKLAKLFDMKELFLTICFRSSQAVVRNARWRAPDMQWRPGAPEGEVQKFNSWSPSLLQDGDAIICRNNAPIFSMALALLREGRYPELLGTERMTQMAAIMEKLGKPQLPAAEAIEALNAWLDKGKKKYKNSKTAEDIYETLRLFLEEAETLGEAVARFRHILGASGRIKLMTGHRSKGLEFDRVFFLDCFLLSKNGQDPNVRYVIETRARQSLFYVTSRGWSVDKGVVA